MESESKEEITDFGFQKVTNREKTQKVLEVFHSVASRYDRMNDVMSLGFHRSWKNFAIRLADIREGHCVLDVAGGTGDLTKRLLPKVGHSGKVILTDINRAMIEEGRGHLENLGFLENVRYVQADAEALPFQDNCFDRMTLAFGLRNVTKKEKALKSLYRVLKVSGRLVILEFSKLLLPRLSVLYDRYSFSVIPKMGKWIAGDETSYQYLVESIRKHPDQETLKKMILTAGFDECDVFNIFGGLVAVHRAYKY